MPHRALRLSDTPTNLYNRPSQVFKPEMPHRALRHFTIAPVTPGAPALIGI